MFVYLNIHRKKFLFLLSRLTLNAVMNGKERVEAEYSRKNEKRAKAAFREKFIK